MSLDYGLGTMTATTFHFLINTRFLLINIFYPNWKKITQNNFIFRAHTISVLSVVGVFDLE